MYIFTSWGISSKQDSIGLLLKVLQSAIFKFCKKIAAIIKINDNSAKQFNLQPVCLLITQYIRNQAAIIYFYRFLRNSREWLNKLMRNYALSKIHLKKYGSNYWKRFVLSFFPWNEFQYLSFHCQKSEGWNTHPKNYELWKNSFEKFWLIVALDRGQFTIWTMSMIFIES